MRAVKLAFAVLLLVFASSTAAWCARRALVVGIDQYASVPKLNNAVADARKVADAFRNLGYQVTLLTDEQAARAKFLLAFQKFANGVKPGDDVVVFYSGHGVEVQGANYLVPTDVPHPDEITGPEVLPDLLLSFYDLIANLKSRNANATIWIIDACRNNPFVQANGKALGGHDGLADVQNPAGTFVFYSAAAGETALDRLPSDPPTERNSVYTREFLKLLQELPAEQVTTLAVRIRPIVKALASPHSQRPSYYDELDGPWCFSKCSSGTLATSLQTVNKTVIEPTTADISKSVLEDADYKLGPGTPPNAIFLGKSSSAQNCEKRSIDTHPFGCEALIALTTSRDKERERSAFIRKPLKPLTEVYLRGVAPTIDKNKGAIYGCPIKTLKTSDTVQLSGIVDLAYAGDTYYWGLVDGLPLPCPH